MKRNTSMVGYGGCGAQRHAPTGLARARGPAVGRGHLPLPWLEARIETAALI